MYTDDLKIAVLIARQTGLDIAVGTFDGSPSFAWAITPEGLALSPRGLDPVKVEAELAADYGRVCDGKVMTHTMSVLSAEQAADLELGPGDEGLEQEFAARAAGIWRDGRLPKAVGVNTSQDMAANLAVGVTPGLRR
jgi:hypothetical protein